MLAQKKRNVKMLKIPIYISIKHKLFVTELTKERMESLIKYIFHTIYRKYIFTPFFWLAYVSDQICKQY